MDKIILISGIVISLISLLVIFFSKNSKKADDNSEYNFMDVELEYRDLKNQIMELMKEFNRSANFNTNILDEKITYVSEMRDDIDRKILKITKMMTDMEIMYNRLEKLGSDLERKHIGNINVVNEEKVIKMIPKNSRNNIVSEEEQILEYYSQGMSVREISLKMGKTLGEIEFIMGLRKTR